MEIKSHRLLNLPCFHCSNSSGVYLSPFSSGGMDNFVGSIHYLDLLCLVTRWPSVIKTSQWISALVAGRMPVDILVVFHGLYDRLGPLEKQHFTSCPQT